MSTRIDDRWLWFSAAVVTVIAVHGIRVAINDLVTLTKLDPYGYEPCEKPVGEHPEDDITVDTLQTLAGSPNPNIANSATGLIVSRALRNQPTISSIRADLRSPDPATRRLATLAFDVLRQHNLYDGSLDAPSRAPYNNFGHSTPVYTPHRRRGAQSGNPMAFSAPNDGVTDAEHARQISEMIDRRRRTERRDDSSDDNESFTEEHATRLSERVRARVERNRAEDLADRFVPGETNPWVGEGEGEGGVVPSVENPVAGWTNVPRARPSGADLTEAELRRYRREAVVIHAVMEEMGEGEEENEGPGLDEEDIINLARRIERETRS